MCAVEADRGQHLVEQLAGAADKGLALAVFLCARRLADEHDVAGRRAVGEDGVLGGRLQRATVEGLERGFQFVERVAAGRRSPSPGRYGRMRDRRAGRLRRATVAARHRLDQGLAAAALRGSASAGGRLGREPVDRRVEHGFVGAGFDQPGQGGEGIGLGALRHGAIIGEAPARQARRLRLTPLAQGPHKRRERHSLGKYRDGRDRRARKHGIRRRDRRRRAGRPVARRSG